MPFNVNRFRAEIGKKGLASPANFRVLFSGGVVSHDESKSLAFLCHSAQLPVRNFTTADITTHGPIRKEPYASAYDDVVLQFYCQEDMKVKKLFTEWQNYIQDNSVSNEFSYFDDYVTDVIIEQFGRDGKTTHSVKLIDAWPMMVSPVDLNWGGGSDIMNLSVNMTFRYWREEPLSLNPFGNFLNVNDLYPNFDISGALDKFGVALFSRADGQFTSNMRQGMNFRRNLHLGKQPIQPISGSSFPGQEAGFKLDNFFLN